MKKRTIILSLLLAVVVAAGVFLFASCGPKAVASGECGDGVKWSLSAEGVLTISGRGEMEVSQYSRPWDDYKKDVKEIVISEGITSVVGLNGLGMARKLTMASTVTNIASSAFSSCYSLTSLVIPEGVETIGEDAFNSCYNLREVTIPSTVTTIGDSAFMNCTLLSKVNVADIAAYCNITFGDYWSTPFAFTADLYVGGSRVTELTIPSGVTAVNARAFSNCTSIEKLTIADSVASIGEYAFTKCNNLRSVKIGSGVNNIDSYAFDRNQNIAEVINMSSLSMTAGNGNDRTGLTCCALVVHNEASKIVEDNGWLLLPTEDVNYIIGYVGDSFVLTLPSVVNGVEYTALSPFAFYGDERIVSITLPETLDTIGDFAFTGVRALCEIVNNTSIEMDNFSTVGGLSLAGITINEGESEIVDVDGWLFLPAEEGYSGNLIAGNALVGYTDIWDATVLTLPLDFNGEDYLIAPHAFHGFDNITEVVIPDSVNNIRDYAFAECSMLTKLTLGAGVEKIGLSAFENSPIDKIVLPASLKTIGKRAFYCGFYVIRDEAAIVNIPAAVEEIGIEAFYTEANAYWTYSMGLTFEDVYGWQKHSPNDLLHGEPVNVDNENPIIGYNRQLDGYLIKHQ